MKTQYREIKGGSVLRQIRIYNNREDCFLTGEFKLISPRPYGETCGDFLNICEVASRIPENRLEAYRPEQILTYEFIPEDIIREYGYKALKGNLLNYHQVELADIYLTKDTVDLEYVVDADKYGFEPRTLSLPFLYIPLLQFSINVEIDHGYQQKIIASFSRYGAVIYEIANHANA